MRIRETIRDTAIVQRADSSLIRALVECDSLGQAHLKQLLEYQGGERLKPPELDLRGNILTATASIDSLAIYLQLKDRYTEAIRTETVTVTRTIEVNRLTWWQQFWVKLGKILTGAALVFTVWRIYKPFKRS